VRYGLPSNAIIRLGTVPGTIGNDDAIWRSLRHPIHSMEHSA